MGSADPRVGGLIRQHRRALGLTLSALAERVGCARSYLSEVENGRRAHPPSPELLGRLERALDLPPGALVAVGTWERTPDRVRAEVARLQSKERIVGRLAEILHQRAARSGAGGKSLDDLYHSGELRRLVEEFAGPTPGEPDQTPIAEGSSRSGGSAPAVESEGVEGGDGALSVGSGEGGRGVRRRGGDGSMDALLPLEVPLINAVAAGAPAEFTDLGYPARVADRYVRVPDVADPDAFATRVTGDSMLPLYRDGDIVVFSPARPVLSGMDCFARLEPDHETTFKRVYFESGSGGEPLIRLQPLNAAYPPRIVPREQVAGLYAAVLVTRAV